MSWSFHTSNVPSSGTLEALEKSRDAYIESLTSRGYEVLAETTEQINEAIGAATRIVTGGSVGETTFGVNLAGHANPNHEPTGGYANDMISVGVSQEAAHDPEPPTEGEPV